MFSEMTDEELQAEDFQRTGDSLQGEGAMQIFRKAAEMHIKIAALLPERY